MLAGLFVFSFAQANAVATTGSIDGPNNVKRGLGFYLKYTNAESGSEYIIVPSVATMGFTNYTFTASGASGVIGPFELTTTGTLTLTLYASVSGVSSGTALGTMQIHSSTIGSGIVDTSVFSDLISFLLPIMIIVMIVLAFKFRDRLPGMRRSD